jgi:hypothetical protein
VMFIIGSRKPPSKHCPPKCRVDGVFGSNHSPLASQEAELRVAWHLAGELPQ